MKKSELTFAEGFLGIQSSKAKEKGNPMLAFDWDKAAQIIKDNLKEHPDLIAEAGGEIFRNGKATNNPYTYLASNWAKPTLILSWDGEEQKEIECSTLENERFSSGSKWDMPSLEILGCELEETND